VEEAALLPPTIDTVANIVGALITTSAKKGVLTTAEIDGIFDEAKAALGKLVHDDVMFPSLQMIDRLRGDAKTAVGD
jgi:hypothetical protein